MPIISESDLMNIDNGGYGPIVSTDPNSPYHPNNKKKRVEEKEKKIADIGRRIAAGASAVGSGISLIPHPAAKVAGTILQIPDIGYDAYDAITNFSGTNAGHLTLDTAQGVVAATGLPYDDIIGIPGVLDDSYTAITGRDMLEDIGKVIKFHPNNTNPEKDEKVVRSLRERKQLKIVEPSDNNVGKVRVVPKQSKK